MLIYTNNMPPPRNYWRPWQLSNCLGGKTKTIILTEPGSMDIPGDIPPDLGRAVHYRTRDAVGDPTGWIDETPESPPNSTEGS